MTDIYQIIRRFMAQEMSEAEAIKEHEKITRTPLSQWIKDKIREDNDHRRIK